VLIFGCNLSVAALQRHFLVFLTRLNTANFTCITIRTCIDSGGKKVRERLARGQASQAEEIEKDKKRKHERARKASCSSPQLHMKTAKP